MAFSSVNISTAFANLKAAFSSFRALAGSVAFFIGLGLMIKGIMSLRHAGQQGKESLTHSLALIGCGAALIYLPTSLQESLITIFGSAQIDAADALSSYFKPSNQTWKDLLDVIGLYARLVGLVSFIRGWVILSKIGSANAGQQHSVGKGLTHIVGGIMLLNATKLVGMIGSLFGVS